MVHHALQMIILITLLLRSGNPPRKRLGDGKELIILEKYMRLWIGRRAQRATICIALTIHRYLASACCLRLTIKTQNRDDIENVNPQDSGPLPEASCTSPKTLRSSFGVLHEKKIYVWCRKSNYKTSDRDNRLLLQSTKDAWTNFKLYTLRMEDDVLRSKLNTLIAFIQDFQAAVGKPISSANSLIRISFT